MKSRIADDIARSDLTSQIASAITTAIEAYQDNRLFFNESRDITFNTGADQDFYSSSDESNIPDLINIDWMTILISTNDLRTLERRDPQEVDYDAGNTSSTNQPYSYAYYQQKIRLYPKPSSSAWTVRVQGHVKAAAPASDAETGNPWMTYAERLIRSRAKYELAVHVLKDNELAQLMSPHPRPAGMTIGHEAWAAFEELKSRTGKMHSSGVIRPYC